MLQAGKMRGGMCMLLTIDVGNTNITMGVFAEEFLTGMFRMTTKRPRTSDEYGFMLLSFLSASSNFMFLLYSYPKKFSIKIRSIVNSL